jgi:biotin transport system substrate-specific component
VYILIGMVGMPVFSNYSGGLAKLAGPTGGYIIGFIPMAVIAGVVIDKFQNRGVQFVGMVAGVAVCYVFGTAWFCLQGGYELSYAMSACVVPFIPFDLVKIVIAMLVGPTLRSRLEQAGIHPAG